MPFVVFGCISKHTNNITQLTSILTQTKFTVTFTTLTNSSYNWPPFQDNSSKPVSQKYDLGKMVPDLSKNITSLKKSLTVITTSLITT